MKRATSRKSKRREEPHTQAEELLTAQEQLLLSIAAPPCLNPHPNASINITVDSDQEEELPNNEIDRISAMVNQLIAKNKVSARNAFDIPLIHLHETRDFQKTEGDNSWKKLSSTLENDYKIYGYRVDATHDWTHRMLEAIIRQDKKEGPERREGQERKEREELMPQLLGSEDDILGQQLERNYRSINILQVETFFNVNPLLEQTRRLFDHNELRGLLLNNLTLGPDYALRIASRHAEHELPVPTSPADIPTDIPSEPVMLGENIFRRISVVCILHQLIDDEENEVKRECNQMEEIWADFGVATTMRRSQRVSNQIVQVDGGGIEKMDKSKIVEEKDVPNITEEKQGKEVFEDRSLGDEDCIIIRVIPSKQVQEQLQVKQEAVNAQPIVNPQHIPQINIQQIVQQIPSNPSITIENISTPVPPPEPTPKLISSIITFKSTLLSNSTDLILRQINDHQPEQPQQDLVQRWKANHPKPKKPKQPKPPTPPLQIDFFQGSIARKYRKSVICLDKVKRKQIKQMLKKMQQVYPDRNQVSQSRGKLDFRVVTWLKELLIEEKKVEQILEESGNVLNMTVGEEAIDVDRTALKGVSSIREAKDKIRKILAGVEAEISFKSIYESFTSEEGYISPALCFLTLLHLTNEHGYSLAQNEQFDFILHKQSVI